MRIGEVETPRRSGVCVDNSWNLVISENDPTRQKANAMFLLRLIIGGLSWSSRISHSKPVRSDVLTRDIKQVLKHLNQVSPRCCFNSLSINESSTEALPHFGAAITTETD